MVINMPYSDIKKQKKYQKHWNKKFEIQRRKELGMPLGTAQHRLRIQLLFKYIKKAGENFCFDCKEEILQPNEISIQHKKVWLHVDVNLFWDLDNIAFSHRWCNKPERYPHKGSKAPHGTTTRYKYHGCRCPECTKEVVKKVKKYREKLNSHSLTDEHMLAKHKDVSSNLTESTRDISL